MFSSVELNRDGLVAKILTWGMSPLARIDYLSKTQNICPMFWRFVFKLVCIALYYTLMMVGVLMVIIVVCDIAIKLPTLTFWGVMSSIAHYILFGIAIMGVSLVCVVVSFKIYETVVSFLPQRRKEAKRDVAKLVTSYREAKRGKFCSPVTFN